MFVAEYMGKVQPDRHHLVGVYATREQARAKLKSLDSTGYFTEAPVGWTHPPPHPSNATLEQDIRDRWQEQHDRQGGEEERSRDWLYLVKQP